MRAITMTPARRLALLSVAGAHLALVAASALGFHVHGDGWVKRAIAEYGALSGADSFYSFFAPSVDTQLRPTFEITNNHGAVTGDVLMKPANTEVDIRIANLVGLFYWEDADLRSTLLHAWSCVVLARHPEAEQIVIRVEACDVPSMQAYRQGKKPEWRLVHQAVLSPQTALPIAREGASEAKR
jgi:hypothetical protein